MKIARRQFLKHSALGLGSAFLSVRTLTAAPAAAKPCDPFAPVQLGRSGVKVSRFCLGTGVKGGMRASNHTRMGREKFEGLIRGAHERGVRMLDLADLYGTHPYVISALQGIPRDHFQIATKIWFRPNGIPEPERPRRRCRRRPLPEGDQD